MDRLDEQILAHLQEDGRASYTDIAADLDVSEGTVRNRVNRLQDDGVIERFTVDVADDAAITVFVMVELDPEKEIEMILEALPANTSVFEVTGDWDLVLKFSRDSSETVNDVLEKVRKVAGVERTTTYTALASHEF